MNCFEFRRYCLSDPATQTAEFLSHKRDCPHCAEFAASVSLMDKRLVDALRVEVPENLASRIILRQSIMRDQSRQKRKRLLALAASVLIALGLGTVLLFPKGTPGPGPALFAHLNTESELLSAREDVSRARLVEVLDTAGVVLTGDLGVVTHASPCPLSQHGGAHLVVAGTKGSVMVLLLRGENVAGPTVIHDGRREGLIVPTETGSLALIGEQGEQLPELAARLRGALSWRL